MNNTKLFNIIQIATGIAVVIGLVMVFVELRQAKSLSLAEITSQGYSEALADLRAVMGENPAPTIAKACYDPEAITPEEHLVLVAFYSSKIGQISRLRVLEAVAEFGVPWETAAPQVLIGVLDNEPGRVWFEQNLKYDPVLYEIGRKVIESGADCKQPPIIELPEQLG